MPWYHLGSHGPSRKLASAGANTPWRDDGRSRRSLTEGGTRPVGARLRDHLPPRPPRPFSPAGALCCFARGVLFSSLPFWCSIVVFQSTPKPGACQALFFRGSPRPLGILPHRHRYRGQAGCQRHPQPHRGQHQQGGHRLGTATFSRLVRPTPPSSNRTDRRIMYSRPARSPPGRRRGRGWPGTGAPPPAPSPGCPGRSPGAPPGPGSGRPPGTAPRPAG